MSTARRTSPLSWIGGKSASSERIVSAFPPSQTYGTYVEVFGGAAHVLVRKPPSGHLEIYNDLNGDLVRFWMAARDQPEALQQRIETLPYSRSLYYTYRKNLQIYEPMDDVERAAKWFYCLRSTFGGVPDLSKGWSYNIRQGKNNAHALRTATALLSLIAERFRYIQIEQQDFASIIQIYQTPRTLFYVDPPYIGCEAYYDDIDGTSLFTDNDHHRLAMLLNATPAFVALSYYDHPVLSELYPASSWRRSTWMQAKVVERTRNSRQYGHEVLLMNYPEALGLWETAQ